MVLERGCALTVGERAYSLAPDDVVYIEAQERHAFRSAGALLAVVQFDQSSIERALPRSSRPRFFCNSSVQRDEPACDAMRRLVAHAIKNNSDAHRGFEVRNWSLLFDFADILYNNFCMEVSEPGKRAQKRYEQVERISRVIKEHYADQISLTDVAEEVGLSAPYLSKFFSRNYGMSFLAYLSGIRLIHAERDLMETEDTIEEISARNGFPNSGSFVRAFRAEHGMLPSVYRKRNREKGPATGPAALTQAAHAASLAKYLEADGERASAQGKGAFTRSMDVIIDASRKGRALTHTWREILTVSDAASLLHEDIRNEVRRAQRSIGFRCLAFKGIFDDGLRVCFRDQQGRLQLSWGRVDRVLDFVLEEGFTPLICLSFMPAELALLPGKRAFGQIVSPPKSYSEWGQLVGGFLEHCVSRYGEKQVSAWRFNIWHEPDTPYYGFSDERDFYDFFKTTHGIVKAAFPQAQVGTPSFFYLEDEAHEAWLGRFLDWTREHRCLPDFVAFTYYDVELSPQASGKSAFGFVGYLSLRRDGDGLAKFCERTTVLAQGLPVCLLEWNTSPSQQDLLNDTCYKSCYLAKSILENYDRVGSFAYWSLSDLIGEGAEPDALFFGGIGLSTKNGIAKASMRSLELIARLGDVYLASGPGWFATRAAGEKGAVRILLYNYQHFSQLYARGERFDMTETNRYTPFAVDAKVKVKIELKGVGVGEYLVRETSVSRSSGSAFDAWVDAGGIEPADEHDLDWLRAASVPRPACTRVEARDEGLVLGATLDALEVRLVEVTPLAAGE